MRLLIVSLVVLALNAQELQSIHKIFVGSFCNGEDADLIRSKVITRLVKSGKIEVVQSAEQADAMLTGGGSISKSTYYHASSTDGTGNASGGTKYHATAGVQLISKDQKILWADDTSNGFFSRSASSSLADNIVKHLLKAMTPPRIKK